MKDYQQSEPLNKNDIKIFKVLYYTLILDLVRLLLKFGLGFWYVILGFDEYSDVQEDGADSKDFVNRNLASTTFLAIGFTLLFFGFLRLIANLALLRAALSALKRKPLENIFCSRLCADGRMWTFVALINLAITIVIVVVHEDEEYYQETRKVRGIICQIFIAWEFCLLCVIVSVKILIYRRFIIRKTVHEDDDDNFEEIENVSRTSISFSVSSAGSLTQIPTNYLFE